ncbi:MAG: segregation/condensation protein A [Deltaproteobacteria bacterium]|nr:segregation/condensation protein A [Deltaproteobacteria bacterium]
MGEQQSLLGDYRYKVSLDVFEGPLDLLLHLIRKHELDIFDIPIAFITGKYLEYLNMMKNLNLNIASDYLEMAAQLALIKSRMMLPDSGDDDDDTLEDVEDPREELVRQLLEYQKYKTAADDIISMPQEGRDLFIRPDFDKSAIEPELESPGLFSLMEALKSVIDKLNVEEQVNHREITITRVSITARIHEILDLLLDKKRIPFTALFKDKVSKSDIISSFLAILEMTKLSLIQIHQAGTNTEIHISASADKAEAIKVLTDNNLEDE